MRSMQAAIAGVVLVTALVSSGCARDDDFVRLRDLGGMTGRQVTVRGRTGQIVEGDARDGSRVYTLRDDYGDGAHVQTALPYPIMGATYDVTGRVAPGEAGGPVRLLESSRERTYGTPVWPFVGLAAAVAVLAGLGIVVVRRRQMPVALEEAWGTAVVEDGPDAGRTFPMRGDSVAVGRDLDPTAAISLATDMRVSRRHGRIIREGEALFYEDTGSTGGSWVNEQPAKPGERVPLSPDSLLRLGRHTLVRIGLAGTARPTVALTDAASVRWEEQGTIDNLPDEQDGG